MTAHDNNINLYYLLQMFIANICCYYLLFIMPKIKGKRIRNCLEIRTFADMLEVLGDEILRCSEKVNCLSCRMQRVLTFSERL